MPLGSGGDHLAAASVEPTHISWEADPDISGIGVVLSFAITATLSLVLVVASYFGSYRGRSVSRLTRRHASFQHLGIALLDQIAVTVFPIALAFFISLPSLSAYTRKLAQLCVSLGNISSTIVFISTGPSSVRQVLIIAVTSLASFSIALHNGFDKESVSAELAWLESDTDQVIDNSTSLEILSTPIGELACLFVVFLEFAYRKRGGRIGELACLTVGIPLILLHFTEIKDLYRKYEPYVGNESMWTFGQILPLMVTLLPILSMFEATTSAPRAEHPESKVRDDISASQNEVPWYFNISLALLFVRKIKVVVILVGAAGACLGLKLLLQWYYGNHATVKQIRPLAGRITYYRNFLHYAFWRNSPNVDYAATSLGLIPSRIWFTRARRIPPGYQRISWKCSCGETLAANFDNSDPHAVEALERRLHGRSNSGVAGGAKQGPPISATSRSSSGSTGQRASTSQGSAGQPSMSSTNGSSSNTPALSRRNTTSSNNSQRASIPRYFELCVSVGQHSVSLGEINISSVATDGQLFSKIWESYHEIKRSSFGAAIQGWFFKPDDVFFVHFGVTKRHQVGIYGKPMEIPPPEEVDKGRYHYFRCPMQPLPPMPDHIFLHYLDRARRTTGSERNPQAHAEDIFLSRLPKKLGSSIFTSKTGVDATIAYGWGVHIVERPSALAQSMVGIASALILGPSWTSAQPSE